MTSRQPFSDPSLFWRNLAEQHTADLARYGFDSLKRHQALRYFTWSWKWGSLRDSRQMRFLLRHSSAPTVCRCLAAPTRLSNRDWVGVDWNRADRWLYVFATRLLWEYARKNDALDVLALCEPELGSPLPVAWRGRRISQDLANTALEVTAITRGLRGQRPGSILEIGAGYGRTAYALLSAFPEATYTIVDIEPALSISRWYLEQLFSADRLRFLRPEDIETLPDTSIDLALAVSSLHEMTNDQVSRYLELFSRVAEDGCVYLKQWARWTNPDDGITLDFGKYPIPPHWSRLFFEPAPVQTNFRQAAWHVGQASALTSR
jgi:putative sugar O-methyltransferase